MPETGINASKANVYNVLSPPKGISFSKALTYSVIDETVIPSGRWGIYVDWDNDNSFYQTIDDITPYVTSMSWRRGRDRASNLTGECVSLSFTIELLNMDGRFNSFLTTGPYYEKLLPGRKVAVISNYGGVVARQMTGFITEINPQPKRGGGHTATISGFGPLGFIREQYASVALSENIDTGAAINAILTAIGWPLEDRVVDTGATVIPYYFALEDQDALNLMRELERSEAGVTYETKDGKIGFESRTRRLGTPYDTSRATLSDAADATLAYNEINQADPIEEIHNKATVTVIQYSLQASAVLWTNSETGEDSPSIEVGATRDFWTTIGSDIIAVQSWTTPVATTDFLANSTAAGTGTNLTTNIAVTTSKFATSMKISLKNNSGSVAYITFLQARGIALMELDKTTVRAEDATSQAKYGVREYPLQAPWLPSTTMAQRYVDWIIAGSKDPVPILTVKYRATRSVAALTESLARDFGDRITLVANGASGLGVSGDFWIEAIEQSVLNRGSDHVTTYELSSADAFTDVWILGTDVLGVGTILADFW